ncbi:unnamed protein product [Urochloa decumbens]|uniref:FAD-binding PCMH-type domain-containing protein n=1 Tax=Urochloa decumbens TaxID=240449 RepID=A0ABC9HCG1_9POAL
MQVLHLKSCYPDAKLIVGNSEVGIETKFKNAQYKVMISVGHVSELNALEVKEDGIHIGSAVRFAQLQSVLKRIIEEQDLHQTSSCQAVVRQLKWFAGTQIRNVASVGGNICTASPISDLNPLWMAADAKFRIIDVNNNVRTTLAKDFFVDYRKVDIKPDELLLSVILPWTRPFEYVKEFKQAHRRADDIALVNAGMRVYLREVERNWIISDISIVYGGVAVVPLSASKTENYLTGKKWDFGLLEEAFDLLKEDIPLSDNAPGGMVEFRRSLTLSFFFKFFLSVTHEMKSKGFLEEGLQANHLSATQSYHRPVTVGTQCYELIRQGTAVGQPMVHMSAMFQVTGESEYTDDTPTPPNTLHAALVLSKKAHARILSIDDSLAKSSPGFAGLFLSKDVPGDNHIQPMIHNEDCFASDVVTCVGQIIGIVVADTHDNARNAANKVHIEYSELPAILSIEEAIKTGSFHPNTKRLLVKGNAEQCFLYGACARTITGEVRVGGQEHFYMEPNCTLIWPVDSGNEMHMVSSTQAGALVQVYTDGTVLVTHGGVEMGQGLHTKLAQVAASSFNIPLSSVFISETSTDKVPNASPTAASASSDIYGAAVLDACQQIKARMEPIANRGTHSSFAELIQACYIERVDLSAHGFYVTPDIDFDWTVGKGNPYHYFTYGAAFAEVEIDTLTGDFHTRTVDIVMDLGFSINPAIDIGQIEGAFIQGLGWVALEEIKWGDDNHKWIRPGHLFTCGPGSYKIPSVNDIPLNFKVSLLKGVPNPKAIHSSKAVGEPPFFLGSSVLFAIKDAIFAARAEEGHLGWFPLDNPATPERIRMACVDSITKKFATACYRPKLSV